MHHDQGWNISQSHVEVTSLRGSLKPAVSPTKQRARNTLLEETALMAYETCDREEL